MSRRPDPRTRRSDGGAAPPPLDPAARALFERYRGFARLLDAALRVPGTRLGVGVDFVLGLVPGLGDAVAGTLGAYGLWVAQRLGAPRSVLLRMAANLAVDTVFGSVPVLGNVFDLLFKANLRNVALLERWLESPRRTQRSSRALLVGVGIGLFAAVVLGIVLVVAALVWLWRALV